MKQRFTHLKPAFLAVAIVLSTPLLISAQAETEGPRTQDQQVEVQPSKESADEPESAAMADQVEPDAVLYEFLTTAYCLRGVTSSGVRVNPGVVAADPSVLPIGSIIRLHADVYSGIYTVLDTGARIKGRRLDLWLPTYEEAIQFGVRKVKIEILRYGWDPSETDISSL